MPAYDYFCPKCKTTVTKYRSMKDEDPGYNCETCKMALNRVYLNAGFILNGPGFFSTDNRKK